MVLKQVSGHGGSGAAHFDSRGCAVETVLRKRGLVIGRWPGVKLASLLAALMIISGCQSTPPAPIDSRSESPSYEGVVPPPRPSSPDVEAPKPVPRDVPPTPNAAVQTLEADAERYLANQQWQKSIEKAEQGLRIDRRNAEFYRILGESYRQLGDISQASRFARQAQRFCQRRCGDVDKLLNSLDLE